MTTLSRISIFQARIFYQLLKTKYILAFKKNCDLSSERFVYYADLLHKINYVNFCKDMPQNIAILMFSILYIYVAKSVRFKPLINAVSNVNSVPFKGKLGVSDKGNQFYETNNGLKVGAIYGGFGAIGSLFPGGSVIGGLIGLGMHSAIGAFIDYMRNKHAAEAADYIKQVGLKKALETRDDIELSENNKPYYRSKDGMKYGTLIGAIIGAALGLFPGALVAVAGSKFGKGKETGVAAGAGVLLVGITTGISALGGLILGKITDYFTNKNAAKHA